MFLEATASGTPAVGLNRAGSTDALQDGKLGTLAEEEQLCSVLLQALAAQKQKRQQDDLSKRVQVVFGRSQFQCHVHALIERHLFPGELS